MADRKDRVIKEHAWPGPTHDTPHFFTQLSSIAMNRAATAGGLCAFKTEVWTALQTLAGIRQQTSTLLARYSHIGGDGMMSSAIKQDHLSYDYEFSVPDGFRSTFGGHGV